jgi:Fe-S-cluster containining protein
MAEINRGYLKPRRLSFPADEAAHYWLSMLLESYYIVDKGIAEAIERDIKSGRKLACAKGCSSCCKTHKDIPVYPLELAGISWYVTEKISGPERRVIKRQLKEYKEGDPCPFLVDGSCSVHPMRPISCRQFIVFGKLCDEGEDPYYTRREDVMPPVKKHVDKSFFIMLPFYGVEKRAERLKLIKSGAVHKLVKLMQTCNWKSLSDKMDDFDRRCLQENKVVT